MTPSPFSWCCFFLDLPFVLNPGSAITPAETGREIMQYNKVTTFDGVLHQHAICVQMYRVGEELTQSAVELLCLESMHLHHSLRRHVFPISPMSSLLRPFHIHQPCNDKLAPVHEVLREEAMVKLLAHEVVVVKRARNDGNQDIHPLHQLGHFLQGSIVLKEAVKCYLNCVTIDSEVLPLKLS